MPTAQSRMTGSKTFRDSTEDRLAVRPSLASGPIRYLIALASWGMMMIGSGGTSQAFQNAEFAASPDPVFADALWLADREYGLLKLSVADSALLGEIPTDGRITALALDERRGLVWTFGGGRLRGTRFDGEPHVNVHVDWGDDEDGEDNRGQDRRPQHVHLAVNSMTGTVWLGQGRTLLKYDSSGHQLGTAAPIRHPLLAMALDPLESLLWVAGRREIVAFEESGQMIQSIDLRRNTRIVDLEVDASDREFKQRVSLEESLNVLRLRATDPAGNSGSLEVRLILDTIPPEAVRISRVVITDPGNGQVSVRGREGSVEAESQVLISNTSTHSVVNVSATSQGTFTALIGARGEDILAILVADAAGNRSALVQIGVNGQALPPVLERIGDQTVAIGNQLQLQLMAEDPNGDRLYFGVTPVPLPPGAALNASTGVFTFRPGPQQAKTHQFTFSVSDGSLSDVQTVNIIVQEPISGAVTELTGRLLDTNDFVRGIETPIVGATVSLIGEVGSVRSDGSGAFTLSAVPAGRQVLDIDTATVDRPSNELSYAGFRETVVLIEGVRNVVDRPFFLPRIASESLTPVLPGQYTVVTNPSLGVTLSIPPHTARNADGTDFTASLSISEVPQALAPANLPPELEPALLITIQPVGVTITDPVPLTVPNIDGLPPGSALDLWSVDVESGSFTVVGTAVVSEDGQRVETTAGGIRAATWHTVLSPPGTSDSDVPDRDGLVRDPEKRCRSQIASSVTVHNGCLGVDVWLPAYRSFGVSRALRFVYEANRARASAGDSVQRHTSGPGCSSSSTVLQRFYGRCRSGGRDFYRHPWSRHEY